MPSRSIELQRRGAHEASVGMEGFMHKSVHADMNVNGIFVAPLPTLFAGGISLVELAPAFKLKVADDAIVRNVATRDEAMYQRVDAFCPLGEFQIVMSFLVAYPVMHTLKHYAAALSKRFLPYGFVCLSWAPTKRDVSPKQRSNQPTCTAQ